MNLSSGSSFFFFRLEEHYFVERYGMHYCMDRIDNRIYCYNVV